MIILLILETIIISILLYVYLKQKQYNKQLFTRAWSYELVLMNIYNNCKSNDQELILKVLDSTEAL
jgi:hypothetical protein